MRHDSEMDTSSRRGGQFVKRHSLSIAAGGLLLAWILLYARSNPRTHLGSFFGNAIADWTGVVVTIIATKYLYEIASKARRHPTGPREAAWPEAVRNHSLTIFAKFIWYAYSRT